MRAGWIVSFVGHVGAVLMSLLAWEASSTSAPIAGSVVPIEIVAIGPESNVRALALPDEVTAENPVAAEENAAPEAAPPPSPTPAPRPPPRPRDSFNLADAEAAINRERGATHRRVNGAQSDRNQQGAGLGTAEVASMNDRIRALADRAFRRCWDGVADLPDPDRLVVNVTWELDRNGHLRGQPVVVSPRGAQFDRSMQTAIDRAMRAVRRCDPLPFPDDPIVGAHYELWRNGDFTFRNPN